MQISNRKKNMLTEPDNREAHAPFIKKHSSVERCMLDVIIALLPALVWSVYIFGYRALMLVLIAVISTLLTQLLFSLATKRPSSLGDMSAVVTGILIAFLMPVTVPLYYPAIAGVFGMLFGKLIFGGMGKNIFNPAATGIVFMLVAFNDGMNRFVQPFSRLSPFAFSFGDEQLSNYIVNRTPLEILKQSTIDSTSTAEKIYGITCGNIGEISALLLIAGFLYLLVRRVISAHTTVIYFTGVVFLTALFAQSISFEEPFIYAFSQLLSGSTVLVGVFMMNDWATTPMTRNGKIVFGLLCAAATVAIRIYCTEPDGAVFALLLMNVFTMAIENKTRTAIFGKYYK